MLTLLSVAIGIAVGVVFICVALVLILRGGRGSGRAQAPASAKVTARLLPPDAGAGHERMRIGYTVGGTETIIPAEASADIMEQISSGNLIRSIKLVRDASGLGLVDAKHAVEAIAAETKRR
jgi:hypothetical protein